MQRDELFIALSEEEPESSVLCLTRSLDPGKGQVSQSCEKSEREAWRFTAPFDI